jgi:hypothetical protein
MQIFVKTLIDKTPRLQLVGGSHNFPLRMTTLHLASNYLFT